MSIYEYDEEEAKKVFREDGRIEGKIEGRIEGKIEGRIEGILETKISDIFELLEDKGEIPQSLKGKISAETDLDVLSKWHKAAAYADSIDEFEKSIDQ